MATIQRNISIPEHIYDAICSYAQDHHLNITANWFSPVICSLFAEKLIREGYLPDNSGSNQNNLICEDCSDATPNEVSSSAPLDNGGVQ